MNYVRRGRAPLASAIECEFLVDPVGSLDEAAEAIAAESSIGTWIDVAAMRPEIGERLAPAVTQIDPASGRVRIAYPLDLFEGGNIAQLLSSVAGNIFGMRQLATLRLVDVSFPEPYVASFAGPAFGLDGIRARLGIHGRPLVGTIIKPKLGLDPEGHAGVAYEAWAGGCDVVKDDENLTSQAFNPFDARVRVTFAALARAEDETGERKLYLANVTAETDEMLRRMEFAARLGARAIMVDLLTAGWSAVQTLTRAAAEAGLAVHAHRAFHAAFTRDPRHGMSMLVVAKLARFAGVDLLHIGTGVGKMHGPPEEVRALAEALRSTGGWGGLRPVFPVASGGLHPLHIPALVANLGQDVLIQAGGGVHGHPGGTRAGARALRQAVDATMQGASLPDFAREHLELAQALEVWG